MNRFLGGLLALPGSVMAAATGSAAITLPGKGQVIELIGSRALGPRDRLVLVQVGNEQILLGLTPGTISALHVLKEPVQVSGTEQATPEFAQRLMELLGKDKDKK